MRMNLPVTSVEYQLPEGEVIVTRTDVDSRITYANEAFVTSSGFPRMEIMGQPQNIVRHPDMPPEAFADLWATVKAGQAWTGIVKNRRKNGDFYWVRANVTPIVDNGRISGFMSVRVKPSRQEVEAASDLYAAMRDGRAGHLKIVGGEVVRRDLVGRLGALARLPLATRMWLTGTLLAGLFAALGISLFFGFEVHHLLLAGAAATGAVLAMLSSMYLVSQVLSPIRRMSDAAHLVAGGDIRAAFPEQGDRELHGLARVLNQMNAKLAGVLMDAHTALDRMSLATAEVANGSLDLSARTEEQASSLEETASSMEEITSAIKLSTDNAKQANQLAAGASEVAIKGGTVVRQVVDTMSGISASSKKIADIIGVIDGIAFQTNILALNAAVEAARAGEQGRGFAVVASEVRNLAQRSAAAAKEIKELITDSVSKVDAGAQLVDKAGATMDELVGSVRRVSDIMAEMSSSSLEQFTGIEQINQAIAQMDQVTQQNAALVEEAAAAAESLREQGAQIVDAVSVFKFARVAAVTTGKSASVGSGRIAHDSAARVVPGTERRSPNRAVNVTRLSARPRAEAAHKPLSGAAAGISPRHVVGGSDDWTEF